MKNSDKINPRSCTKKKSKSKQRDEGYLKYQRYIRSKEFAEVKRLVKERDNYTCQCCGRTQEEIEESGKKISLSVHHRTYRNLYEGGQKEAADCITLCSVCHLSVHRAKSNLQRFKRK